MPGRAWKAVVLALAMAIVGLWPAIAGAGGGGCYGGATQGEGDTIAIKDACFTPNILRADPGTEVMFVNRDPFIHNVSAMEWGWYDKLGKGDGFRATFDESGIYPFACTYHPGMTGAIVVGDGEGPGSGELVAVKSLTEATPVSQERMASEVSTGRSNLFGWIATGAAGLFLGAAVTGLLRRRRPQA